MEPFEDRIERLKKEQRTAQKRAHSKAAPPKGSNGSASAARLTFLSSNRLDILVNILESLECSSILKALCTTKVAAGYIGPETVRNAELSYAKVVLRKPRKRWFFFGNDEDQIGVRVYDAKTVYVEVAEFEKRGEAWRVIPLTPPMRYTPGNRDEVAEAIREALLRWAQPRLG